MIRKLTFDLPNPSANEELFYGAKNRYWIKVHNEETEGWIISRVKFLNHARYNGGGFESFFKVAYRSLNTLIPCVL